MIENDNPFDSPDFADLLPEMVHFSTFASAHGVAVRVDWLPQMLVFDHISTDIYTFARALPHDLRLQASP